MKNLDMLGMATFPFCYAYQSQWGKKIQLVSKGQRSKKLYFHFSPPTFSVLISKYEIMRTCFLLVANEFACFLFWPPAQMTFLEETEGQWKYCENDIALRALVHTFRNEYPFLPFFTSNSSFPAYFITSFKCQMWKEFNIW